MKGLKVIVGLMMLLAIARLSYGYYIALRWVATFSSAIIAFEVFSANKSGWGWCFLFIAALYNPFIPVHLTKSIWMPINFVTALLYFGSIRLSEE